MVLIIADKWFINIFAYFELLFLKIPMVKNLSPEGCIASISTKIIYYLTNDIINKNLNRKIIDLKQFVSGRILYNFVLYHCVKEIKK